MGIPPFGLGRHLPGPNATVFPVRVLRTGYSTHLLYAAPPPRQVRLHLLQQALPTRSPPTVARVDPQYILKHAPPAFAAVALSSRYSPRSSPPTRYGTGPPAQPSTSFRAFSPFSWLTPAVEKPDSQTSLLKGVHEYLRPPRSLQ